MSINVYHLTASFQFELLFLRSFPPPDFFGGKQRLTTFFLFIDLLMIFPLLLVVIPEVAGCILIYFSQIQTLPLTSFFGLCFPLGKCTILNEPHWQWNDFVLIFVVY